MRDALVAADDDRQGMAEGDPAARGDQGLATDQMLFDAGCLAGREDFHDGSIEYVVVRHDGKLLNHETVSEHGA